MSKYHISGVPVVDKGKLKGILTNRDIRFETNLELKVSDRISYLRKHIRLGFARRIGCRFCLVNGETSGGIWGIA